MTVNVYAPWQCNMIQGADKVVFYFVIGVSLKLNGLALNFN